MIDLRITCRDRMHDEPYFVASLTHLLGDWAVHPPRCDLQTARHPREGYRYRCRTRGAHTAVSRDSLHDMFRRLHAHGHTEISIQGLRTLPRTPGARLKRAFQPSGTEWVGRRPGRHPLAALAGIIGTGLAIIYRTEDRAGVEETDIDRDVGIGHEAEHDVEEETV